MFDMKKLQQMQTQMQNEITNIQKDLDNKTVEAASGGGAVRVVMNGNQILKSIKVAPEAVDPDDLEMLEDLVLAAVNSAVEKSRELKQSAMGNIAGGVLPPGFNLPF
jgi:DNA-binding YbaB/EbfC family protein